MLLPSLKDSDSVMCQVYLIYKLWFSFSYQETSFIYISYTKLLLRFAMFKMAIWISIALAALKPEL